LVHFLIKWELNSNSKPVQVKDIENLSHFQRAYFFSFTEYNNLFEQYHFQNGEMFVLGDPVFPENIIDKAFYIKDICQRKAIKDLGGFFYIIDFTNNLSAFIISGSFNIYPIYYYHKRNLVLISSTTKLIKKAIPDELSIDKQYLLERLLFNYSFSNRTFFSEIKVVKSNHFIKINESMVEIPYWDPSLYITTKPKKGQKVLEDIANLFYKNTLKYLPNCQYAVSFTGGFDGRSLVAASMHAGKNFITYSFGSKDSSDLSLPLQQAKELNIEYKPIILDETYITKYSYNEGQELISITEGNASFARAHYLYATKMLSEIVPIIITGNFGSELFRVLYTIGVILSSEMYHIIGSRDIDDIRKIIKYSHKLDYLNIDIYQNEINSLIEELMIYRKKYIELDPTILLYLFRLNEVFRKYFGPEIVMQSYFLSNRTPFLDYKLIEFIMSTAYCGAYRDSIYIPFLNNFKHQLPYAYIIKKCSNALLKMMSNKGYSPYDLLKPWRLIIPAINKKIKPHQYVLDPFSVVASYEENKHYYKNININDIYFNNDKINNDLLLNRIDKNTLFHIYSINEYLNKEAN